jgi:hypothetical protein
MVIKRIYLILNLAIIVVSLNSCDKFLYNLDFKPGKAKWVKTYIKLANGNIFELTPSDLNTNFYIEISSVVGAHYFKFLENDDVIIEGRVNERYTGTLDEIGADYNCFFILKGQKFNATYFPNENRFSINKFPFSTPTPDTPAPVYYFHNYTNSQYSNEDIISAINHFEYI